MALITFDIKNENDYKNRVKIFDLVKNHFHLNKESLEKFNSLLFHPKIDEIFVPFLDDSFRIEKKIINKNDNQLFDKAWTLFNIHFVNFQAQFNVTYENFINNSIIIDGEKRKLFKFINSYFTELNTDIEKKVDDLHSFGLYDRTAILNVFLSKRANDVSYVLDSSLKKIGANKIPLKANKAVISFNFVDWFLCSTAENWSSCLSLDSSFSNSYWSGLPGLAGDYNRGLFYITDEDTKTYLDITVERLISRSWILLNNENELDIVKFYPIDIDKKLLEMFNFKYGQMGCSKYPVDMLYDEQDTPLYIFQDTTHFDQNNFLVGGGKGWACFNKSKKFIEFNFIQCGEKLKTLVDNGKKISNYLIPNKCAYCSVDLVKTGKIINEDYVCKDCYDKNKKSFCCSCNKKIKSEEVELYLIDGKNYCKDCYDSSSIICEKCGDVIHIDDAYHSSYGCYFCETCYYEDYSTCDICGSETSIEDSYESPDSETMCYNCYNRKVRSCDSCSKDNWKENLYEGLEDDILCEDCFDAKYYRCENCDCIVLQNNSCECEKEGEEESAVST